MKPSRVTAIAVLLSLCFGCGTKPGSKTAELFPQTGEVPGWSRAGETRTFQASNLWEYIDGDAERYVQAGVEKTLTTDYRFREKVEAVADIHLMKTADGARKIFESEASAESQRTALGDDARLSKGTLTFRKGSRFVRLVAYQEDREVGNALLDLGRAIEKKLGQQ
jgi:hypothetical protein